MQKMSKKLQSLQDKTAAVEENTSKGQCEED